MFHYPKSLKEALTLLESIEPGKAVILAGGTDVVPKMNSRPERSGFTDRQSVDYTQKEIVYIGGCGLDYVNENEDDVRIGATAVITGLIMNEMIRSKFPVLVQAMAQMAGETIRNRGTLGGNIMNASPSADSVPALIALDAEVKLDSASGSRTVRLDSFFTGPGRTVKKDDEILTEIIIPKKGGHADFIKFGRRNAESLSIVSGASYLELSNGIVSDCIIVLGSVAPTAIRITEAENLLKGKEISEELIREAGDIAERTVRPISDQRASADYRKTLSAVTVRRTLEACLKEER